MPRIEENGYLVGDSENNYYVKPRVYYESDIDGKIIDGNVYYINGKYMDEYDAIKTLGFEDLFDIVGDNNNLIYKPECPCGKNHKSLNYFVKDKEVWCERCTYDYIEEYLVDEDE